MLEQNPNVRQIVQIFSGWLEKQMKKALNHSVVPGVPCNSRFNHCTFSFSCRILYQRTVRGMFSGKINLYHVQLIIMKRSVVIKTN